MAKIVCERLGKSFAGTEVVKDFNLSVDDHEFVVFLGPSGCGKSTILRMIAGLEEIGSGNLSINGRIVNDLPPRDRKVAMVFQNYALYPHMSVYDNIAFGLRRQKVSSAEIDRRVGDVAQTLGIGNFLKRRSNELSGGQQQRVAIARAMIKTPDVFLFDEPLSNLDAKLRNHMRVEIAQLHQKLATTTIYVTHDQLEAMTLADRIVLLRGGEIEQVGTPEEIYQRPKTLFAAGFIGAPAMNLLDVVVAETSDRLRLTLGKLSFEVSKERFSSPTSPRAVLGLRPSAIGLSSPDVATNLMSGAVKLAEYLGDQTLISVALGDSADGESEITALVDPSDHIAIGQTVRLGFDEQAAHLFDAATGASLLRRA